MCRRSGAPLAHNNIKSAPPEWAPAMVVKCGRFSREVAFSEEKLLHSRQLGRFFGSLEWQPSFGLLAGWWCDHRDLVYQREYWVLPYCTVLETTYRPFSECCLTCKGSLLQENAAHTFDYTKEFFGDMDIFRRAVGCLLTRREHYWERLGDIRAACVSQWKAIRHYWWLKILGAISLGCHRRNFATRACTICASLINYYHRMSW